MLIRALTALAILLIIGVVVWIRWHEVQREHRQSAFAPPRMNFFLELVSIAQSIVFRDPYVDSNPETRRLSAGCFLVVVVVGGLLALMAWVLGYIPGPGP